MVTLRSAIPSFAKKIAWNVKYALFGYAHFTAPGNTIQYLCSRLRDDSNILELGCGRGSMLRALREGGCRSHYCGVDISKHAIEYARLYGDQRSAWIVSDIETFRSPLRWNAILLIESIYYVNVHSIPLLFSRLRDMLEDDGFVLVRVHDVERHRAYLDALTQIAPRGERIDATLISIRRNMVQPL